MLYAQIIDGRAILSSAIARLQTLSPKLAGITVTAVVPSPDHPVALAALISARQKRKAFSAIGFKFREIVVDDVSRKVFGTNELVIVQRPLNAADVLSRIGSAVIDLEAVAEDETGHLVSAAAQAAIRIHSGLPAELRSRGAVGPLTAIVGAKGFFGSQLARYFARHREPLIALDAGDDLTRLHDADVIISAVGKPHLIGPHLIGASTLMLIDLGFFYNEKSGQAFGDFEEGAYVRSRYYVPTPGGMGPLQILTLIERALKVLGVCTNDLWSLTLEAGVEAR